LDQEGKKLLYHARLEEYCISKTKQSQWPESARELYQLSERRLSAKLVPTFADRGCHVVSVKKLKC
jgi:hypothetical protein